MHHILNAFSIIAFGTGALWARLAVIYDRTPTPTILSPQAADLEATISAIIVTGSLSGAVLFFAISAMLFAIAQDSSR